MRRGRLGRVAARGCYSRRPAWISGGGGPARSHDRLWGSPCRRFITDTIRTAVRFVIRSRCPLPGCRRTQSSKKSPPCRRWPPHSDPPLPCDVTLSTNGVTAGGRITERVTGGSREKKKEVCGGFTNEGGYG
ncbi:hypothetical protein CEXT_443851 [Caerostris extrusa]|uniref:Uncharacterized protein n=1 Tax=Caerostris extrusa TaxID=172846 RepID=A0AAV4N490_CAEEX|nr:hypothetical protein CEXT_443851 [Caerostris extrusa]